MLRSIVLTLALLLAMQASAQPAGKPTPWCEGVSRSSFVNAVCYDERNQRLSLQLNDRWYQYCGVSPALVQQLLSAPSIGSFFQSRIRGRHEC